MTEVVPSFTDEEKRNLAKQEAGENVNLAHASLLGLHSILDEMEDEFGGDSRYYALMSCLNDIIDKLDKASEACDKL